MSKHTPGPWRYVRGNGSPTTGQHMIAGAKPGYLAEVRDCGSGNVEANARLIAAAPDLLDAIVDLEERLEDGHWSFTKKHLRALIAKATGASHD